MDDLVKQYTFTRLNKKYPNMDFKLKGSCLAVTTKTKIKNQIVFISDFSTALYAIYGNELKTFNVFLNIKCTRVVYDSCIFPIHGKIDAKIMYYSLHRNFMTYKLNLCSTHILYKNREKIDKECKSTCLYMNLFTL